MEAKRAKRKGASAGTGIPAAPASNSRPASRPRAPTAGPAPSPLSNATIAKMAGEKAEEVDVSIMELAGLSLQQSTPSTSTQAPAAPKGPSGPASALPAYFAESGADSGLESALEEEVAPKVNEPTMMSKEARQLMLSGLGSQGLEMWKVRAAMGLWVTWVGRREWGSRR